MEARDKPMLVHWLDKKPLRVMMILRRNLTAEPLQNQPHLFANTSNLLTKTINDEDQQIEMVMMMMILPLMMTMKRRMMVSKLKKKVM